ncbi:MAG: Gx transporter family protein [Clostridia bacterium]
MQLPKISTQRVAITGIMLSLALILSLIETALPPIMPVVPYAKIGFSNIVLLVALMLLGYKSCILILIIKCLLVGIFSGNIFSIVYSLPAGIISYSVTALIINIKQISLVAVSTVGSIVHNIVQILVASIVIGHTVWLTLPYLLLLGGAVGVGIGVVTFVVLKYLPHSLILQYSETPKNKNKI